MTLYDTAIHAIEEYSRIVREQGIRIDALTAENQRLMEMNRDLEAHISKGSKPPPQPAQETVDAIVKQIHAAAKFIQAWHIGAVPDTQTGETK